jgi:tripartite-type tricarboxylate transporter receptor subunit TctC
MRLTAITRLIAAAALTLAMGPVSGQTFPVKPVHLVVPTPPGGTLDWISRAVGEQFQQRFKQVALVENRPGAGSIIGMEFVSRAAPDGHVLIVTSNSVAAGHLFNKDTTFDPQKGLAPVSIVMRDDWFLWVSPEVPAKNLKEFIAYAKAKGGTLNHGAVTNTMQYLDSLRLIEMMGVSIAVVPYQGGAASTRALLANEIQSNLTIYSNFVGQHKAGKVRALAVTAPQRSQALPDVPTARESGVPFDAGIWYAYWTTPGTPAATIRTLSTTLADIMKNSPVTAKVREQGLIPVGSTPEELASALQTERNVANDLAKKVKLP